MVLRFQCSALRPLLMCACVLVLLLLAACGISSTENQSNQSPSNEQHNAETGKSTAAGSSNVTEDEPDSAAPQVAVDSMLVDSDNAALDIGGEAPNFAYTLPDGTTYTLSELRGKKVLINFWGTTCPPCIHEMPAIEEAHARFKDEDFVVLGVNGWQERPEAVTEFAEQYDLSFQLITNTEGDIGPAYGVPGLPVSFFINSDGTLNFKKVGVIDTDLIASQLDEMY